MIAVIFELEPRKGPAARYFELAAALPPMLATIDGVISAARIGSLSRPGRTLSLSW